MYKMYLKNPEEIGSMRGYLDISQEQITYAVNKFTKFFVPIVYGFVAFFVITIYVAVIIPMMNKFEVKNLGFKPFFSSKK